MKISYENIEGYNILLSFFSIYSYNFLYLLVKILNIRPLLCLVNEDT